MSHEQNGELYAKVDELIGLRALLLRWPLMGFRKIACLRLVVSNQEEMKHGITPKFFLMPYVVSRTFQVAEENEPIIVCGGLLAKSELYKSYLAEISKIVFLREDVLAAERSFPDLKQVGPTHKVADKRLMCGPANVGEVAQITLYHLLNTPEIKSYNFHAPRLDYWSPTVYQDIAIEVPPEGFIALTVDDLKPIWAANDDISVINAQPKLDLEQVKEFIISRCQQGQTDATGLAQEIDNLYPGLTDGQLGRLLPTALFRAQTRSMEKINYRIELYNALPKVTADANRKRGQRLRGKSK